MNKLFKILQQEFSLSDKKIQQIKKSLSPNNVIANELFMGQANNNRFNIVIGAPCIRNDIHNNISLNTLYQIIMPMIVAKKYQKPCKIFLGIAEEIILQANYFQEYEKLGYFLEKIINKIGSDQNIDVQIINTAIYKNNLLISQSLDKLNIQLNVMESSNLFNFSKFNINKPRHSTIRMLVNKRVIACNVYFTLEKFFGKGKFLIVEDLEQYETFKFAQKLDKQRSNLNFLAFIPLPSTNGKTPMFKAENDTRFLLGNKKDYYQSILKKSPSEIRNIYKEVLDLIDDIKISTGKKSDNDCIRIINKLSGYFSPESYTSGEKVKIHIRH